MDDSASEEPPLPAPELPPPSYSQDIQPQPQKPNLTLRSSLPNVASPPRPEVPPGTTSTKEFEGKKKKARVWDANFHAKYVVEMGRTTVRKGTGVLSSMRTITYYQVILHPKLSGRGRTGREPFTTGTQRVVTLWRRYSDFAWVRRLLANNHPSILIPSLPKKSLQGFRRNPRSTFRLERKAGLGEFLQRVIDTQAFSKDKDVASFLTPESAFSSSQRKGNFDWKPASKKGLLRPPVDVPRRPPPKPPQSYSHEVHKSLEDFLQSPESKQRSDTSEGAPDSCRESIAGHIPPDKFPKDSKSLLKPPPTNSIVGLLAKPTPNPNDNQKTGSKPSSLEERKRKPLQKMDIDRCLHRRKFLETYVMEIHKLHLAKRKKIDKDQLKATMVSIKTLKEKIKKISRRKKELAKKLGSENSRITVQDEAEMVHCLNAHGRLTKELSDSNLEKYFPKHTNWLLRVPAEDGLNIGCRDVTIQEISGNFRTNFHGNPSEKWKKYQHTGLKRNNSTSSMDSVHEEKERLREFGSCLNLGTAVSIQLENLLVTLQAYQFRIRGSSGLSKLLGALTSPNHVMLKLTGAITVPIEVSRSCTKELPQFKVDPKRIELHLNIEKEIKGAASIPDRLANYILKSLIPKLIVQGVQLIPLGYVLGPFFLRDTNGGQISGEFKILGELGTHIWQADITKSDSASREARRLLHLSPVQAEVVGELSKRGFGRVGSPFPIPTMEAIFRWLLDIRTTTMEQDRNLLNAWADAATQIELELSQKHYDDPGYLARKMGEEEIYLDDNIPKDQTGVWFQKLLKVVSNFGQKPLSISVRLASIKTFVDYVDGVQTVIALLMAAAEEIHKAKLRRALEKQKTKLTSDELIREFLEANSSAQFMDQLKSPHGQPPLPPGPPPSHLRNPTGLLAPNELPHTLSQSPSPSQKRSKGGGLNGQISREKRKLMEIKSTLRAKASLSVSAHFSGGIKGTIAAQMEDLRLSYRIPTFTASTPAFRVPANSIPAFSIEGTKNETTGEMILFITPDWEWDQGMVSDFGLEILRDSDDGLDPLDELRASDERDAWCTRGSRGACKEDDSDVLRHESRAGLGENRERKKKRKCGSHVDINLQEFKTTHDLGTPRRKKAPRRAISLLVSEIHASAFPAVSNGVLAGSVNVSVAKVRASCLTRTLLISMLTLALHQEQKEEPGITAPPADGTTSPLSHSPTSLIAKNTMCAASTQSLNHLSPRVFKNVQNGTRVVEGLPPPALPPHAINSSPTSQKIASDNPHENSSTNITSTGISLPRSISDCKSDAYTQVSSHTNQSQFYSDEIQKAFNRMTEILVKHIAKDSHQLELHIRPLGIKIDPSGSGIGSERKNKEGVRISLNGPIVKREKTGIDNVPKASPSVVVFKLRVNLKGLMDDIIALVAASSILTGNARDLGSGLAGHQSTSSSLTTSAFSIDSG
ncbi:hypothetical protein AAMO2058_001002600 [Amorphochlora amoebiformis]